MGRRFALDQPIASRMERKTSAAASSAAMS
jgi:hypothetical protein